MDPPGEPADAADLRARLYRPGASEADVRAYLRSAALTEVDRPVAPTADPGRERRVVLIGALVAVAVIVPVVLSLTRMAGPASRASTDVRCSAVLGAADSARATALLASAGSPSDEAVQAVGRLVVPRLAVQGQPNLAVALGGASGRRPVDVGAIGVTASGHPLQVVIVTPARGARWTLTGRGPSGRVRVLSTGAAPHGAIATRCEVGVPAGTVATELRVATSPDRPFAYILALSG